MPRELFESLRKRAGVELEILDGQGDETVSVFDTTWYRRMKKTMTPGAYLRVYRRRAGLAQAELGRKLSLSRQHVWGMESGQRGISKDMAKRLAALLKAPVERFL